MCTVGIVSAGPALGQAAGSQGDLFWHSVCVSLNRGDGTRSQLAEAVAWGAALRQTGPENAEFVWLLERLREGRCLESDFAFLDSLLLSACRAEIASPNWINAPIIVADNISKDALNEQAAQALARTSGKTLHWYYATDHHRGEPVQGNRLKAKLESLHSGKTSQRLGRIPLVIGMPMTITHSYNVEDGAVNGSKGILKRIRYRTDGAALRRRQPSPSGRPANAAATTLDRPTARNAPVSVPLRNRRSMSWCGVRRVHVRLVHPNSRRARRAVFRQQPLRERRKRWERTRDMRWARGRDTMVTVCRPLQR